VLALALLILALGPAQVTAGVVFTKVADTATLIPDGTGAFTSLGNPSIDNGRVVFVGNGAGGQTGIYEYYGGKLTMRVNQNTSIPGGTGGFTKFDIPSLDGADIAFQANGASKQTGVYLQYDGTLVKIVDTKTQVPGTKVNFTGLPTSYAAILGGEASLDNRVVSFTSTTGIYLGSETEIVPIATQAPASSTPIPGQPSSFNTFDFDLSPSYSDGALVFGARYDDPNSKFFTDGLYRWTDATGIQKIIDQNSVLPGQVAPIDHFLATPFSDGESSYFNLVSLDGNVDKSSLGLITWEGVFRHNSGGLTRIISPADVQFAFEGNIPGVVLFSAVEDDRFVFPARNNDLWTFKDGALVRIAAPGDILHGKVVDRLKFDGNRSREFLSGDQIAVTLDFTDGSSGIYIATIPEPSTFALALVAFAGLAIAIRRRGASRSFRVHRGSA
jgi:hypothetical protein